MVWGRGKQTVQSLCRIILSGYDFNTYLYEWEENYQLKTIIDHVLYSSKQRPMLLITVGRGGYTPRLYVNTRRDAPFILSRGKRVSLLLQAEECWIFPTALNLMTSAEHYHWTSLLIVPRARTSKYISLKCRHEVVFIFYHDLK